MYHAVIYHQWAPSIKCIAFTCKTLLKTVIYLVCYLIKTRNNMNYWQCIPSGLGDVLVLVKLGLGLHNQDNLEVAPVVSPAGVY